MAKRSHIFVYLNKMMLSYIVIMHERSLKSACRRCVKYSVGVRKGLAFGDFSERLNSKGVRAANETQWKGRKERRGRGGEMTSWTCLSFNKSVVCRQKVHHETETFDFNTRCQTFNELLHLEKQLQKKRLLFESNTGLRRYGKILNRLSLPKLSNTKKNKNRLVIGYQVLVGN